MKMDTGKGSALKKLRNITCPYTGIRMISGSEMNRIEARIKECVNIKEKLFVLARYARNMQPVEHHVFDRIAYFLDSNPEKGLMDFFSGNPNVGFCWDSGHEMCYNYSRDMLAAFGDRLLGTHLNDNLGIRDLNGEITWLDDLHLLPFDGIADWQYNCERLRACNFDGPLTFELNIGSKPGRHENDAYGLMAPEIYLAECYKRACRVRAKLDAL